VRSSLIAVLCVGCTAAAPSHARLDEGPELVALEEMSETVMDEVPRARVGFAVPDGTPTELDRDAIAFVPRWRDGAALIDPERRLYQVWPNGERRMLVRGAITLATDGDRLAYVVIPDLLADLRVHDGETEHTLASGFASIGVLRVEPERVLFVGARPGGIAGVWIADRAGARCVTNCDLRTGELHEGEHWLARYVPPPTDPSRLEAP